MDVSYHAVWGIPLSMSLGLGDPAFPKRGVSNCRGVPRLSINLL
jgi:hypothetical protein